MPIFAATFGDKKYELEKLTLGDWLILKRELGLGPMDLLADIDDEGNGRIRVEDPAVIVGLCLCAEHQARPEAAVSVLLREVEALDLADFELVQDVPEVEADPTQAADDAATESKPKAKGQKQGTRRKTSGTPA